jgi:polysaccharide pyruvyl transferase WcaK-like protein
MRKKILILNDRFPIRDALINLGDRAMVSGLYKTVQEDLGYQIVSGGCKNFPYYNIRRYKKEMTKSNAESVFKNWFEETTGVTRQSVQTGKNISDFLDTNILFQNRLFQKFEEKVKARFSRGLMETFKPYLLKKYYAYQFIEKIKSVDCVLFNGTAIVADRFDFYLPALLFECYLAKRLGKKVFTINQSIDIENPLNAEMVSHIYRNLDLHLTREPLSKNVLLRLGVEEEKLISSCDAAFAADYQATIQASQLREKEGLRKGAVGLVIRGDRNVDFETWARIIDHLEKVRGKKVFLAFTCITQDEYVYNELAKRCNLVRLSRFYDYKDLTLLLESFDYLISDRYHALIFAIHAKTPVIPINPAFNTIKTEGLFRLFDYPVNVMPPVKRETYDHVMLSIQYVEEHNNELKEILTKASVDIKNKLEEDIKEISRKMMNTNGTLENVTASSLPYGETT